ncbi:hypothetical protein [Lachnospira eligens]|jgi:hypothetical protein|uniref:Uncharacterized protein n=2 Tax=root TaxID=1 RepID=A0A415MEF4_9FIRM|nr:hypothetical protein [Lachnospira eligens]DAE30550.1 MAG TPA: hypothetical protein [virus sp. ctiha2]DAE89720.1 MAG TPA: hypothetical protein [Bacteriophage sp.]DAQ99675.1 MAG TPA: hypothetical protein [Caudoviricetes sp.]RHA50379.1 hypothetical protein DW933_02080 [Lachnospira eligens]RHL71213.1 hypothetical protein DW007_03455 [Lachnospira eligens]
MYTFKIKNKDGKVQEYNHINKVYYGHKGVLEYNLENEEIFNHHYSVGYDLHLYSDTNAFTISKSEISIIEVIKEN